MGDPLPPPEGVEHPAQGFPTRWRGMPGTVPGLVEHLVVGAETKDIEAVIAPGGNRGWAGEHPAQGFPTRWRGMPGTVPGLVEHLVIGAEAKDVEAVIAPGDNRGWAGEHPAQGFPTRWRGPIR